ncbi:b(o/a)3-type cytochrome-c oxidase subunit 1 [Halobellus sp. EA9]|uniref:b(o/a)3-type cytochrome-c oxidase subunit 1 n=1 Tax=Halobellus sp. EA9 TaxID=3421647 RepID=UPI003EB7A663
MTFVDDYPKVAKLTRWHFAVAFVALALGGFFGLLQALYRTGTLRSLLPINATQYYTVLTGHGVLLALVFTTFFICGFFLWAVTRSLDRPMSSPRLAWLGFGSMVVGTALAAIAILNGFAPGLPFESADVLYTFYAPLKAHPAFYVGAALLIVGSWIVGAEYFLTYRDWRRDNPDSRIPLQTFMVLTTFIMWYLSTLGVAVEVLVFLIPWSLGWISQVDPLLTRTLFWYFGHPVVYFWLLPGYVAWYTILPKLAGGRLFSDPLARVVFVLFVLLSTPVGFHHQYVDPGIAEGFKFIAMTNTMMLLLPSLLTAFTVVASMEHGARQRGGEGYLNWLRALPWDKPAFAGMALAGLMFAAGGFSGMINAGMNINYLIHNTLWVPGHFHLTVGTAFALTAMASSYWLYPQLTGKRLQHRRIAIAQPYVWFVGMTLMSNAMHRAGLAGVPRRTAKPLFGDTGAAPFDPVLGSISEMQTQIAVGGTLLFLGLVMFLVVMLGTWLSQRGAAQLRVNGTLREPLSGASDGPRVLDNLRLWAAIAVVLVVIAYGLPLWGMIENGILAPGSVPFPT